LFRWQQYFGSSDFLLPEIPRGGMGKESLAREVLRVDVQLGGHVTLRTYR
jgi:hypothetical protein